MHKFLFDVGADLGVGGGVSPADSGVSPQPAVTPTPNPTPNPAPATPAGDGGVPQAGRTFTQSELDGIIQDRLRREQTKYEGQIQQYNDFFNQLASLFQPDEEPGADSPEPNPYEARVTQLESIIYGQQVDGMEKELRGKYADITDEMMDNIYKVATQYHTKDLEGVYKMLNYDSVTSKHAEEMKTAKEAAIKEYLEGKGKQPPTPEGAGGSVPPGANVPKTWDDADKAVGAFFRGLK